MSQSDKDLSSEFHEEEARLPQRRETLLLDFYRQLIADASYQTLIHMCSLIMDNPVLLLDENSHPVIQEGFQNGPLSIPPLFSSSKEIYALFDTHSVVLLSRRQELFSRFILGIIPHEGQSPEYLCVPEWHTPLHTSEDLDYVANICRALAKVKTHPASRTKVFSYTLNSLILELLQEVPAHPTLMKKHLESLHWMEHEKYYVLAIDKYYKNALAINYSELRRLLKADLYEYKNYIVAILGCRRYEETEIHKAPEFFDFLRKYNMRAGLSHGFFDITRLSVFFRQSVTAIRLDAHYDYHLICSRYEDLMITHLLDTSIRHKEFDLLNYCHPITLNIYEYDKSHDTDYLNTLAAYLFSNKSPRLAAQVLYIHPNTMYNRIVKLKEEFRIDFDDLGTFSTLLLSIHALGYLGIIDRKLWDQLYRPLPPEK